MQPNREAFSGGPVRQDLNLHQTTSRPVLLVEPHATHYRVAAGAGRGGAGVVEDVRAVLRRCFTKGTDVSAMRAQALGHDHRDFHDRLALPGWVPAPQRSTVSGRVDPGPGETVAVLSDNGVEYQRTALGYAYWADVRRDGHFEMTGVRPGTYRLTVYREGVWDDVVRDDVVVAPGCRVRLPVCRFPRADRPLWQVGTPNRTSVEFRRGREFRQWGTSRFFAADFRTGWCTRSAAAGRPTGTTSSSSASTAYSRPRGGSCSTSRTPGRPPRP